HAIATSSRWPDSNRRSPAPKAGGLPGIPTSRNDSHRSGWSCGEAALTGSSDHSVYQVDGSNGENEIQATGSSATARAMRSCSTHRVGPAELDDEMPLQDPRSLLLRRHRNAETDVALTSRRREAGAATGIHQVLRQAECPAAGRAAVTRLRRRRV